MKHALLTTATVGQRPTKVCEKCDCVHWPWPKDCNDCCGVSEGTVVSLEKDRLVLKKAGAPKGEFKLTPQTKILGTPKPGENAKVYYKRSIEENVATTVTVDVSRGHKDETEPEKQKQQ